MGQRMTVDEPGTGSSRKSLGGVVMTIATISKQLFQVPRYRAYHKSFHRLLCRVLICLLAALVFSALYGPPAWAQKTGAVVSVSTAKETIDVDQYLAEGYSVHGPMMLESASAKALVFPGLTGQKGLEISLTNKAVVVLDAAGNTSRLAALGPGVSVLVCHRKDRVIIYLKSATKGVSRYAH
jgi:hypothetical protein